MIKHEYLGLLCWIVDLLLQEENGRVTFCTPRDLLKFVKNQEGVEGVVFDSRSINWTWKILRKNKCFFNWKDFPSILYGINALRLKDFRRFLANVYL